VDAVNAPVPINGIEHGATTPEAATPPAPPLRAAINA
jgi:hypothetical protein